MSDTFQDTIFRTIKIPPLRIRPILYGNMLRVLPVGKKMGPTGTLSVDILTGWNLIDPREQDEALAALDERDPLLTVVSPPCQMFSVSVSPAVSFREHTPLLKLAG